MASTDNQCENFVRVLGMVMGVAFIVLSLLVYIKADPNWEACIRAFYNILLGLLMILAETKWKRIKPYFGFMLTYFGKGLFYIFCAGLAFNASVKILQYVMQGALCVVGVGFILLSFFHICDKKEEDPTKRESLVEEEDAV
mmetsp:Transcript_61544/g.70572  ORF Transcript_61544/g.70572 Transcript_61544/m.70572 type:complete len:141 (-) Transcript_61544:331-753(-)